MPKKYSELDLFTRQLASVLSCIIDSNPHANNCNRTNSKRGDNCQLCLDLSTADKLIAQVDWDA